MPIQIRRISVFFRRRRSIKEGGRTLQHFHGWREGQRALPAAHPVAKRLLIVRLDDIGDYLLFRNQLQAYKESTRWSDHAITLLGNTSWRDLFTAFDAATVDAVIWVDKARYLTSAPYREEIWQHLRAGGFETVVAPSRTRPLLLDDLCMLAASPLNRIGSTNTYVHDEWNEVSDTLYRALFTGGGRTHEFHFNARFAQWVCGVAYEGSRPELPAQGDPPLTAPYVICFVGANTRSKRWPVRRWIEFIVALRRARACTVVLAGASRSELQMAAAIGSRTEVTSIAGKVSLPELVAWVGRALAVVTNDTMAAHLGASLSRPTVIVANGVNHSRFTEYTGAGIDGVITVYPEVFNKRRARLGDFDLAYEEAVSADIASISAIRVHDALNGLLG